ncbi:MAG: class I SAM-dependent methyltransferase [Candidatus Hinthialibacter antarcticus]|nr:class I SAM-dependent methyltransferase [Candidatus Hinthialibacter antarcticus]
MKTSSSENQSRFSRIQRMLELGQKIWTDRPDLQESYPDPASVEYWFWLMWSGAEYYQEVKQALYPVPERFLVDRVVGEFVPDKNYHTSGIVDARRMIQCFCDQGFQFNHRAAVLDFGCGCSRLLRFFALFANECRIFGADVDPDAIEWCGKHIDFATFQTLQESPPAPYEKSSFDAVYAYSVFSHFSEELQVHWLKELHRISKSGAILVLTVQGKSMAETYEGATPVIDWKQKAGLSERGFAFFPYQQLVFQNAQNQEYYSKWNLQNYGDAFILKPYIEKIWGQYFDLLDHLESPDGSQDYVILRNTK